MGKRKASSKQGAQSSRNQRTKKASGKKQCSTHGEESDDDGWDSLASYSCDRLDGHESASDSDESQPYSCDRLDGHESASDSDESQPSHNHSMSGRAHPEGAQLDIAPEPDASVELCGMWAAEKLKAEMERRVMSNTALTSLTLRTWRKNSIEAQELAGSDACTRLRKLHLSDDSWKPHHEQTLRALLAKAKNLEKLGLSNCTMHVEACRAALRGLKHHTALQSLDLFEVQFCCGNDYGSDGRACQRGSAGYVMAKVIENMTSLTKLDVRAGECLYMEHGVAKGVGSLLAGNYALQTINTFGMDWKKDTFKLFGQGLAKNTTLRRLSLRYNGMETGTFRQLAKALETNSTLQELDLACLNQSHLSHFEQHRAPPEIAQAVAKMIATNKGLVTLDLGSAFRGHCGLLGQGLALNSTLKHLNLEYHELDLASVVEIGHSLACSQTLQTLKLGSLFPYRSSEREGLAMREAIIAALGRMLQDCVSLRNFVLAETNLKDNLATDLYDALLRSSSLRYLGLSGHSFTQEGVAQICELAMQRTSLAGLDLGFLSDLPSARAVADLLMRNTTLQHLCVHQPCDSEILSCVYDALIQGNRTLRSLSTHGLDKVLPNLLRANALLEVVDLRDTNGHLPDLNDATLRAVYQALEDTPRRHLLTLHGVQLDKILVAPDAPVPRWWDLGSTRAIARIWDTHARKALAFAMGLHARLGSESVVRQATVDGVNMVLLSYYSLPFDHFLEEREQTADLAAVGELLKSFDAL
jgi:Ran GTPase-activating protein (RanGAP) involved in mRNA processing and transport